MKIQNYFYAFFILVSTLIILITNVIFYSSTIDYKLNDNVFNYSENSFKTLVKEDVYVNSYNEFVDCNVNKKGFDFSKLSLYFQIDTCRNLEMVNKLSEFYDLKEILVLSEKEFDFSLINENNYLKVLLVVSDDMFKQENFSRYLDYEKDKAVLNVNLNHDLDEYSSYNDVSSVDELVVVNPYNKLVKANSNLYKCDNDLFYSFEMCQNVKMFFNELVLENINYNIIKAFDASNLFDEHATGLAFDLDVKSERISQVESIASKYGLIFRYKDNYSDVLSWGEKQTHLRYVGSVALEIYSQNISLEEFLYTKK